MVSGKVTISNKYAQSVKIYFRTDTIADDNLLQKLHLKIACDGQTLYDGSMAGEITNKVLLGDFAQGSSKDLTYTLTVPAELDNQYAMNKTKTKWIFTAELPETPNKTVATGDSSSIRICRIKHFSRRSWNHYAFSINEKEKRQ